MSITNLLNFGSGQSVPMILQTEATECGLACLAMVAGHFGKHEKLSTLRSKYAISSKGATLAAVMQIATELGLGTRPLSLDIEHLSQLRTPCILHWNFNHFVVLVKVGAKEITIHDPASGIKRVGMAEVRKSFTGVALELWPNEGFELKQPVASVKLRSLMGKVIGLKRSMVQVLLLALALEVFALTNPFFIQWVIDEVMVSGDRDLLATLAIGFGVLMVIQQLVTGLRAWILLYMGTTLNIQWRSNVFTHLLRLPINYFERRSLGDVTSRFGAVDQIQRTLTTSFIEAILDGLMTIVTLVMMLLYSKWLALVAIITMTLYGLGRWLWYRPLRAATEAQIAFAAKQTSHFLETMRGVKAIKLFDRQNERRASWLSLLADQINAEVRTQKLQLAYRLLNGLLFGIESILVIWLGARLVLDGDFTVGALLAFNAYRTQFDSRVSSLIDKLFEIKMLQLQGERLADIVFSKPEPPHIDIGFTPSPERPSPRLQINGLRFRYAEHEPFVLDDLSLTIEPGESVAIAGVSGCGKTTLMNVMMGILEPTSGEILIDGKSLSKHGPQAMRALVGTVTQDDILLAGSIGENICFFDPAPDLIWMENCARLAAISDEIAAMPMGFNTLIGELGTVLSGGQKQRVILARAFYKRPRILFFDEATSHLDVGTELAVNNMIARLNITRIIIAHRPETIKSADRAVTLFGGRIVSSTKQVSKNSSSSDYIADAHT